jgi:spermidine/putrescine transport system permease protein
MTAPAIPATRAGSSRALPRIDRSAQVVEAWLRGHAALVYVFLYLPILIVVIFSFNANRLATIWSGFSMEWYEVALKDRTVQRALLNSFIIAIPNAILATTFGTMAALGLQRVSKRIRLGFDGLTYVSIIVPEVVIALSTLVLFGSAFDVINPVLSSLQGGPGGFKLSLGHVTIILAHVLFNTSLVLLLVRARLSTMDRTMVEASADLFATPWRTFRQITFPQLLPAIVAGFLLSFTFSFDDYVITSFVSGPGSSTLPLFVFGQVKRGVSPETNAVAAMMLLLTLTILIVGQIALARSARRRGARSAATLVSAATSAETPG